jgi:predicted RecA/RadA family phage recombinase
MAKNFIYSGSTHDALVAPAGGVVSGKGYLIGAIFVIALTSAAEGDLFTGREDGAWELDAVGHVSAQAIGQGGPVYWDTAAGKATKIPSATTVLIGAAIVAKPTADTTVQVNLWGRAAAPVAAITKPVATAATATTPYGFASQAQADALVTAVRALIDAAGLHGIAIPA